MFTPGQIVLMYIVTIIFVYSLLVKILSVLNNIYVVRKCTKMVMNGFMSPNDLHDVLNKNKSNKEENSK